MKLGPFRRDSPLSDHAQLVRAKIQGFDFEWPDESGFFRFVVWFGIGCCLLIRTDPRYDLLVWRIFLARPYLVNREFRKHLSFRFILFGARAFLTSVNEILFLSSNLSFYNSRAPGRLALLTFR